MVDLDDVRARPDVYQKAATDKGIDLSVEGFLKLDSERRELIPSVEEMRSRRNSVSKEIPKMEGDEKDKALVEMKELKSSLDEVEKKLEAIEVQWNDLQFTFPSIPLDSVPIGPDESGNVEARTWGEIPTFDFEPKSHIDLGESLDILDFKRGVKVSGNRGYFLKGDGARLQQALLRYTMDSLIEKGWTLFSPPLLALWECFMGTGFFPGAEQQNIYAVGGKEGREEQVNDDHQYLIGTSEVAVCSYHKDETLEAVDLPKRYCGMSSCFRREAGSYGRDTQGLYRVHQFEKVEQVVLCRADQDEALALFEEIRTNAEDVLQALEIPYRVLDVCTGDMGKGKVVMQDLESWMPSRESYGETHSCSYLGDFQARRLNLKYAEGGEKHFVHTLNNTCIASPRALIPILEIYQNPDGTVRVPKVLQGYMGGQEVIGG